MNHQALLSKLQKQQSTLEERLSKTSDELDISLLRVDLQSIFTKQELVKQHELKLHLREWMKEKGLPEKIAAARKLRLANAKK